MRFYMRFVEYVYAFFFNWAHFVQFSFVINFMTPYKLSCSIHLI